jgi:2-hydroxy-3-keto-5-methylthiopentenyl-1-phosphate phosphatase
MKTAYFDILDFNHQFFSQNHLLSGCCKQHMPHVNFFNFREIIKTEDNVENQGKIYLL